MKKNHTEIATFLKDFKKIASKDGIFTIPRRKNLESLTDLGLTIKNRYCEIMGLAATNYCKGPLPDDTQSGYVWVFGKEIEGKEVYIKLKIANVGNKKIAKCLSFHKADFPLCFPCKRGNVR